MKKVALIARDGGPKNLLSHIGQAVTSDGGNIFEVYGGDDFEKNLIHGLSNDLKDCDTAIVGIHASNNKPEETIVQALVQEGATVIFIEDTYRSGFRLDPEVAKWAPIICAMKSYKQELFDYGFPAVLHYGPPAHWEKEYALMKDTKPASHLLSQLEYPDQKLVLVGGGKDPVLNNSILYQVSMSLNEIGNFALVFGQHPGEKEFLTDSLAGERTGILKEIHCIDKGNLPTSCVAAVADACVFFDATTLSIGGAYARKPMLMLYNDQIRRNIVDLGIPSGRWFVEKVNSMLYAEECNLTDGLDTLLNNPMLVEGYKKLQKDAFPLPDEWFQAQNIAEFTLRETAVA